MDLLIDSSLAQIEQLLLDVIGLGLKRRLPPAATVTALRALPTAGASGSSMRRDGDLIFVAEKNNVYKWIQSSSGTDDGNLVIVPADAGSTGRWTKQISTVLLSGVNLAQIQTGVLSQVVLGNGDFGDENLKSLIFGQAPCVAIHFVDEQHSPRSDVAGALYDYRVFFEIWSVSRNYRETPVAAVGSPIAAEAAVDPGVMKIHGAVKKLLTGQDLGQPGIKFCQIHEGRMELADLAERVFVMSLNVEVLASIHNPDAAGELIPLSNLGAFSIQRAMASEAATDPTNEVFVGYAVAPGGGLTHAPTAGSATVAGTAVYSSPAAHTFSPNSDTYRDLKLDGTFVYAAVPNGTEAPNQPANTLRVGVTVTDGANVIYDAILAYAVNNWGSPDIVPSAGLGVTSLAIVPATVTQAHGTQAQITAPATYADGSIKDIAQVVAWISSAPSVATIDQNGLITILSAGATVISCSYDGLAAGNTCSVTGT